jgi:hypothetical protein
MPETLLSVMTALVSATSDPASLILSVLSPDSASIFIRPLIPSRLPRLAGASDEILTVSSPAPV